MDAVTLGMANAAMRRKVASRFGRIAYMGDSITAAANQVSGSLQYTSIQSPIAWAQHLSGYRFREYVNGGVAGDRTDQVLARFATAANFAPAVVVGEMGTNDAVQDVSAATIIANLTEFVRRCQAIGAVCVLSGIPPRNALTAPQRVVRNTVNRWMADNAAVLGFHYASVDQILTDTTSSQQWATNFSQDGTHPTGPAAFIWGRAIANILNTLAPAVDVIPGFQYDAKLLSGSTMMAGSGSTPGSGITGPLATGWGLTALNGTVTAVASKVARTDYIQGEWQQIVVSAQSGDTVGVRMQLNTTSGFVAGTDSVWAFAEYELGTDLSNLSDVTLLISAVGAGSSVKAQAMSMSNTAGTVATAGHRTLYSNMSKGRTGILITDRLAIPADATASINLEARFIGLGTIRWGRIGVMKV